MSRVVRIGFVAIPEMASYLGNHAVVDGNVLRVYLPDRLVRIDLDGAQAVAAHPPEPLPVVESHDWIHFGDRRLRAFADGKHAGIEHEGQRQILWTGRNAVAAKLWPLDATLLGLQVNDQHLVAVDPHLRARFTARCRPYIYDLRRIPDGPVCVATAGQGGSLYELDGETGELRIRTNLAGGAADLSFDVANRRRLVASGWASFVVTDGNERQIYKAPDAFRVLRLDGNRVALLCNPPTPGVLFAALA